MKIYAIHLEMHILDLRPRRRRALRIAIIAIMAVLSFSAFPPAQAHPSALVLTPAEIRAAIDARLVLLWPTIQTKESNYFSAHGHYWQGLRTHTILPADGDLVLPNVGTTTPTDQPDPWPVALRSTPIEMAVVIDVYNGPLGDGYVASVWVMISGRIWMRSAQIGPETWRTDGWHEVVLRGVP